VFFVGWLDVGEVASRIVHYISGANHVVQLLVSEAILTSKDRKYVMYSTCAFSVLPVCSYIQ